MEFTLPALSQDSFSRWYNKKVPRADNKEERIVYPGVKLHCSTKSRDLRSQITPAHVFVTRLVGTDTYYHKVLGSNNAFLSLPKRLYSHCFRNINIHSIPTGNRITVRLTETTEVVLPYIPDDFVTQKRSKRNSMPSRSRTKRESKRRKANASDTNTLAYSGWVTKVLSPSTDAAADNAVDSFHLIKYIRSELTKCENELDRCIPNPFAGAATIQDVLDSPQKMQILSVVVQFVHHYMRHAL